MPLRYSLLAACAFSLVASLAPAAEFKPEVIKSAKRATAAVIDRNQSVATAICIHESGYFLTSAALTRVRRGPLRLVIDGGEKEERIVEATVVRSDDQAEFALLQAAEPGKYAKLKLADTEFIETQPLLLVGYPQATLGEKSLPATITIGRITAIPKERGELTVLEVDARLAQTDAGGPALNEAGEVVAVATWIPNIVGRKSASLVIPARHILKWLARPELELTTTAVPYANRHEPQTLAARVTSFQAKPPEFAVRLKLGEGPAAREIELARGESGLFAAKTPLVEKRKANLTPVEVVFAGGGLVRGLVEDVAIKAGKAGERLSQLRRIERRGDRWAFVGQNGEEHLGERPSLKKSLQLGGATIEVPWSEARSITIFSESDEPSYVPYELVLLADGKPLESRQGQIAITGRPPSFDHDAAGGDFIPLTGAARWPAAFEAPPIATGSAGLKGLGRRYVRTVRGDLLGKDFSWELVFTIAKDDPILFIGLGEGRSEQHEGEPGKSVNFRIHSEEVSKGEVVLTRSGPVGGQHVGTIPAGTHRVVLRKRGDRVTFAIDVGNNGPSPGDIEQIVPDLRGFAPFLTETNTYLFFGGGGTFQKMRLVEGAVSGK